MKWLMQKEMHEMISDKCRNNMSITMPWKDAYVMHDMNVFTDTRAQKIISSYLRIRGRSAPCVQLRRWYGLFGFLWQKTRPTYNAWVTTWCRCTTMQQGDVHNMEISSNNHTTKAHMTFRLYAWDRYLFIWCTQTPTLFVHTVSWKGALYPGPWEHKEWRWICGHAGSPTCLITVNLGNYH